MMVISDLNIVCLHQKTPVVIKIDGIDIDILYDHNGYGKHWSKLKNSNGVWYQFSPSERVITHLYNDEFFDFVKYGESYVIIALRKYYSAIIQIVGTYIEMSPDKEILFLVRLDENGESENEIIINYLEFITKLRSQELFFNTIYRVKRI